MHLIITLVNNSFHAAGKQVTVASVQQKVFTWLKSKMNVKTLCNSQVIVPVL